MTSDEAVKAAISLFQAHDIAGAERLLRAAVRADPASYSGYFCLAELLERTGREDEAVACYETCMRQRPGMAQASTRRALILLRRHLGLAANPPTRALNQKARGVVQMTTLGANGRFGNQLLQYAFLRSYAERFGFDFEVPDWIGRPLFGLDDPLISRPLPQVKETEADLAGCLAGRRDSIFVNVDFWGYFTGDTSILAPWRDRIRSWFQVREDLASPIMTDIRHLTKDDGTLVALHLRRGDFGTGPHWIAPESWYTSWLAEMWSTWRNPRLYIATDDPATYRHFAAYQPVTAADLRPSPPGVEFLVDFLALRSADVAAVSNSSFSVLATMLADAPQHAVRPDREGGRLVRYNPWSSPVLSG